MGKTQFKCCIPFCESVYGEESNIHFFKFPSDSVKKQKWTEIVTRACPNINIKNNSRICQLHFSDKHFTDSLKHRLSKFGYPDKLCLTTAEETSQQIQEELTDFSSLPATSQESYPSTSQNTFEDSPRTPEQKDRQSILKRIGVGRVKHLSPRKKILYDEYKLQKTRICKIKSRLLKSQNSLKALSKISNTIMFKKMEENFNDVTVNLMKSQFRNVKLQRPSWTQNDKIFALAIYKRGPRCYRFLRQHLNLPSISTLTRLLHDISLSSGINLQIIKHLQTKVTKYSEEQRKCVLLFDEMSLKQGLTYDTANDTICGYVDLGHLGKLKAEANHALVFMLSSLNGKWKQPIAYYFTRDQVKTVYLKQLLKSILTTLIQYKLQVVGCVCDQGTTNTAAVQQLLNESEGSHFIVVEGRKIFMLYDVPHLIKNIRNALSQYEICFEDNKVAKWNYIRQAFEIDLTRRFQAMRKIKEIHFKLNLSFVKMKVAYATQIFSKTVASTMELMVAGGSLPAEAIYTAEFVDLMDSLFDSLNSRNIRPIPGKPLKRALQPNSAHIKFWNECLPKIAKWKFVKNNSECKPPRCVKGLIFTINSIKELYGHYIKNDVKILKTRCLQQDPLENFFSTIRYYGGGSTNPDCYKFVGSMKTAIVNNLSSTKYLDKNCEDDDLYLLTNFKSFIGNKIPMDVVSDSNELLNISDVVLETDLFESETIAYVCGFFIKKFKFSCEECLNSFKSEEIESFHTFTTFKENESTNLKLNYCNVNMVQCVRHIYDLVSKCLEQYPHIQNIRAKIKELLHKYINVSFIKCDVHKLATVDTFFNNVITCIIRKFTEDRERQFISDRKNKYKKLLHL